MWFKKKTFRVDVSSGNHCIYNLEKVNCVQILENTIVYFFKDGSRSETILDNRETAVEIFEQIWEIMK